MKTGRTAEELQALIRAELSQHHAVPAEFTMSVIRDGESWRVSCPPDPDAPEQGEVIARAVEIGDELARRFDLRE